MDNATSEAWFHVQQLEPGVHLSAEPAHVNSFVIEGRDRAILFDTGLGIGNIREAVSRISDLPVSVVNSHHHFDHVGGNHLFDEIAIHHIGGPLIEGALPQAVTHRYLTYVTNVLAAWQTYAQLDRRYFHLLSPESTPRSLPAAFAPEDYRVMPSSAGRLLEDGDVIDLNGRTLHVLHTPGHSEDGISLIDEENGLLFAGHTINVGPIYAHQADCDLEKFTRSTRRLADLGTSVRRVFVAHYSPAANDASLLSDVADAFEQVAEGSAPYTRNIDCFDSPVREAVFSHFSILRPPGPSE